MSKHTRFEQHLRFARALRTPDEAANKRVVDHFNAQKDLFTYCQTCGEKLKGTIEQIKAHTCSQ